MQVFAKTDIGRERKQNEDSYYIANEEDKVQLFMVADGMGGYNAGEVASKMAIDEVKKYIDKHFQKNKDNIEELLVNAIENANSAIYKKAEKNKELKGMGTTLDVSLIYNSKVYIGHIGDSRVYRIRKDFMRRLTKDHSYVQTLIEDGTITKEEAFNHPKKNMITKALGCNGKVEPDIYVKTFIKNDILLMTSDGLTNMIKEDEIFNIIKEDKENAVNKLVEKANDNGGYDNITVVIIMK